MTVENYDMKIQFWSHIFKQPLLPSQYTLARLIINFIVPWGTFSSYYYRPDGTNGGAFAESESEQPSEKLWRAFITGDDVSTPTLHHFTPSFVHYDIRVFV